MKSEDAGQCMQYPDYNDAFANPWLHVSPRTCVSSGEEYLSESIADMRFGIELLEWRVIACAARRVAFSTVPEGEDIWGASLRLLSRVSVRAEFRPFTAQGCYGP